jgi:DNA-directed RNA polymerase subunit N (RpoN/RPB10)
VEKSSATSGTRTSSCLAIMSPRGACALFYFRFVTNLHHSDALDELQLKRYCCRRMVLTHVDLIEKLLHYNREQLLSLIARGLSRRSYLLYQRWSGQKKKGTIRHPLVVCCFSAASIGTYLSGPVICCISSGCAAIRSFKHSIFNIQTLRRRVLSGRVCLPG